MEDVAQNITKRLYGDDKVKYEFIRFTLNNMKKVFDILNEDDDEFFESMSKGHLDEYMMGVVEFYEENFYLKKWLTIYVMVLLNPYTI